MRAPDLSTAIAAGSGNDTKTFPDDQGSSNPFPEDLETLVIPSQMIREGREGTLYTRRVGGAGGSARHAGDREGRSPTRLHLNKVKPRRIKHHPNLWSDYLRLLDADLDGRTLKQIATALEEEEDGIDEKKVWDRLKAAKKLTKPPGYLDIVLSSPRTPK